MSMGEKMLEAQVDVLRRDLRRMKDLVATLESRNATLQGELRAANLFVVALVHSVEGHEVRIQDETLAAMDQLSGIEILDSPMSKCKVVRAVRKEAQDAV